MSPEAIRRNLRAVTDSLTLRHGRGELTQGQYRDLVAKAADELLASVDPENVSPTDAWEYGEVLRDAGRWADAEKVLRVAVQHAVRTKNEDRRINDTLRLARVMAEQGKASEAIQTARQTFNASPENSAPILLAVYLEILPVARKDRRHLVDLGKLVEEAIAFHEKTAVDANTEAGKAFLAARPHHLRKAWEAVIQLYETADREDLAEKARRRASASSFGSGQMVQT